MAKGPEGTLHDQLPHMMQVLLAERFNLQVHRETKEFNVYALVVGKNGPKLKEMPLDSGNSRDGASFGMSMSPTGVGRLEVKNGNMTALASTLSRILGPPVIDRTGLTGRYDFDLEYSRADSNGIIMAAASGGPLPTDPSASVFASIQLVGLKLDAQKLPVDAIVVDHAEKTATEN